MKIKTIKGEQMVPTVLPPDLFQFEPAKRYAVLLTDDVPVGNLIAPFFEERFGYRK